MQLPIISEDEYNTLKIVFEGCNDEYKDYDWNKITLLAIKFGIIEKDIGELHKLDN